MLNNQPDTQLISQLKKYILQACQNLKLSINNQSLILTHPPNSKFGHLSSNIAFLLAKKNKQNPLLLADQFKKELDLIVDKNTLIEKIEIAPPAFINFYLQSDYLIKQAEILNYSIGFKKNCLYMENPKRWL